MKKIYMSPTMDVIELKNQQTLLAGSLLMGDGDINPANADAPDFGGSDPVFVEDVVNFFE